MNRPDEGLFSFEIYFLVAETDVKVITIRLRVCKMYSTEHRSVS